MLGSSGHVANATATETTGCLPVSRLIRERRLRFFGHVARPDPEQDHHLVIGASLGGDLVDAHVYYICTWLRGLILVRAVD